MPSAKDALSVHPLEAPPWQISAQQFMREACHHDNYHHDNHYLVVGLTKLYEGYALLGMSLSLVFLSTHRMKTG